MGFLPRFGQIQKVQVIVFNEFIQKAFIVDGACVEQGCSEVTLHWEWLCGPGEWKEMGQIHVLFVVMA